MACPGSATHRRAARRLPSSEMATSKRCSRRGVEGEVRGDGERQEALCVPPLRRFDFTGLPGARRRTRGSSRASSSARPSCRIRLLSTSDCSVSRSASATFSAASSVQPPAKTARRANRCCSSCVEELVAPLDRRPQGALALRQVPCSTGQERQPLLEPLEHLVGREHPDSCRRKLQRKRQVVEAPADLATRPRRLKSGSTARARARKKPTASSWTSGGTGYSCSPVTRSGSRLVTSRSRLGHAASSAGELGAASTTCSKLSKHEQHAPCRRCAPRGRSSAERPARSSRARAAGRAAPPAGPTRRRPGTAAARPRRLEREPRLPVPPGPVRVSRRAPLRAGRRPRPSSRSLPRKASGDRAGSSGRGS